MTLEISPSGPSYSPERKRVRLALLRAYAPFLNELTALKETLKTYQAGFDSRKHAEFQNRWQVWLEVAPSSQIDNAEEFDGDREISYLENLSRMSQPLLDISKDQPVFLFWDARYVEPTVCRGEADLALTGEHYLAIPKNISINEAIAFLKAAGVREQKSYLRNTDGQGLTEAMQVLTLASRDGLKVPDIVRHIHPSLNPETFKSKSTRYAKLLKQMVEIIEPPPSASQQN